MGLKPLLLVFALIGYLALSRLNIFKIGKEKRWEFLLWFLRHFGLDYVSAWNNESASEGFTVMPVIVTVDPSVSV